MPPPAGLPLRKFATLSVALLYVCNEARAAVLTVPVLYTLWRDGGTAMQVWLAFCTLAGIALSVIVPLWGAKWIAQLPRKSAGQRGMAIFGL